MSFSSPGKTSTIRSMSCGGAVSASRTQVTGLGGGERQANGLQSRIFTDQDTSILAQRRAQRSLKRACRGALRAGDEKRLESCTNSIGSSMV